MPVRLLRSLAVPEKDPPSDARPADARLGLAWLVRVRYGAVALFAFTLVVCRFALGLEVDYAWIGALLGLTLVTNFVLSFYQARATRFVLPFVLAQDVGTLAISLALSGGAANPFSVFFLVHVALAAVLLRPVSRLDFRHLNGAVLRRLVRPCPWRVTRTMLGTARPSRRIWRACGLPTHYRQRSWRTSSERFRARCGGSTKRPRNWRILALQNERLATLTSFSATAAHELASPLSTIAVAADELEVAVQRLAGNPAFFDDIRLIQKEIRRSRDILTELSSRAGESMGEMPGSTTAGAIVDGVLSQLAPRLSRRIEVEFDRGAAPDLPIVTTRQTLVYLLHSLIRNAFEAQDETDAFGSVRLRVGRDELLRFRVLDRGPGVPLEILSRIGEPFVTTKSEQGGLGLGLFLARAFAERVGGTFALRARSGGGTEAELSLPEGVFAAKEATRAPYPEMDARCSWWRTRRRFASVCCEPFMSGGSTFAARKMRARRSASPKRRAPSVHSSTCVWAASRVSKSYGAYTTSTLPHASSS